MHRPHHADTTRESPTVRDWVAFRCVHANSFTCLTLWCVSVGRALPQINAMPEVPQGLRPVITMVILVLCALSSAQSESAHHHSAPLPHQAAWEMPLSYFAVPLANSILRTYRYGQPQLTPHPPPSPPMLRQSPPFG